MTERDNNNGIHFNSCSLSELKQLPGIGSARAKALLKLRDDSFEESIEVTPESLSTVSGISRESWQSWMQEGRIVLGDLPPPPVPPEPVETAASLRDQLHLSSQMWSQKEAEYIHQLEEAREAMGRVKENIDSVQQEVQLAKERAQDLEREMEIRDRVEQATQPFLNLLPLLQGMLSQASLPQVSRIQGASAIQNSQRAPASPAIMSGENTNQNAVGSESEGAHPAPLALASGENTNQNSVCSETEGSQGLDELAEVINAIPQDRIYHGTSTVRPRLGENTANVTEGHPEVGMRNVVEHESRSDVQSKVKPVKRGSQKKSVRSSRTPSKVDLSQDLSSSEISSESEVSDEEDCPQSRSGKRSRSPPVPKMATFDGVPKEWKGFIFLFRQGARSAKWKNREKCRRLVQCLRGKALDFVQALDSSARHDYGTLVRKLKRRFGQVDPPVTIRRQLQTLRQEESETLDEFAERARELVCDGYPNAGHDVVEDIALDVFLKGCREKAAVLSVVNSNPKGLDQALRMVRGAIHNHRAVMGKSVSFSTRKIELDSDEESYSVRSVRPPTPVDGARSSISNPSYATQDDLKQFRGDLNRFKDDINRSIREAVGVVQRDCPPQQEHSQSPGRSPSTDRLCSQKEQSPRQGASLN